MPIELDNVTSGYNLSVINDNFQKIEQEWDEKLDRLTSTQGNQMEQDLDMNGNSILNAVINGVPVSDAVEQLGSAVDSANSAAEQARESAAEAVEAAATSASVDYTTSVFQSGGNLVVRFTATGDQFTIPLADAFTSGLLSASDFNKLSETQMFTQAEKDKLATVGANSEQNVQADWDEENQTSDAFIRNKPDILKSPDLFFGEFSSLANLIASTPEFDLDDNPYRGTPGEYAFVNDRISTQLYVNNEGSWNLVGFPNVQADWEETNTSSDAYIRNKPTGITPRTDEEIRDVSYAGVQGGTGINVGVNSGVLTITSTGGGNTGGEANVQADWDETNTSSDAYIQNKPDIITSAERTRWNGIPVDAERNVNADWNATVGDAVILNKPAIIEPIERIKLGQIESFAQVNQTDAEIKTQYERNPNTNAFTDAERTKLTGLRNPDYGIDTIRNVNNIEYSFRDSDTDAQFTIPAVNSAMAGLMTPVQNNKLDGISPGADANVRSDWNAVLGDSVILNKPVTITPAQINKLAGIAENADVTNYNVDRSFDADRIEYSFQGGEADELFEVPVATNTNPGLMSSLQNAKLNALPASAEANVNADWDAVSGDAFILNKPVLAPANAEANVQADWGEANTQSDSFIVNKPTIPTLRTASQTVALLETLTGDNRLPASAVRDLPAGGDSNYYGLFDNFTALSEDDRPVPAGSYAVVEEGGEEPELYLYDTGDFTWIRVGGPIQPFPGDVGSHALAQNTSGSFIRFGRNIAGSSLRPANAVGAVFTSSPTLVGTWMCLGYSAASGEGRTSLFVRIR